jgi:hypothetical protein
MPSWLAPEWLSIESRGVHEAMKGRTHVASLIAGDLIRTYQEGEHEGTMSIARQVSEMVRLAEKAGIKPAQE